ncbi:MAG: toll/interleukin-1 receptor domain-containing protein, partial [Saprospiraceae bacterium]
MHTFILHATENQDVAQNIKENLEQTGISAILDNRQLSDRAAQLQELASKPNAPIIILVTDNFLRCRDCMYEALNFLRNPNLKARV